MTSIVELYQHQLDEVLKWQRVANDLWLENLKLQALVQEYRELVLLNPLNTLPESQSPQAKQWYAKARVLEQRALESSNAHENRPEADAKIN